MKENFIPEELVKVFLKHVEGKSFTLTDVAVALDLDEETAVSILIYSIENKLLDVTCTWVPNKK